MRLTPAASFACLTSIVLFNVAGPATAQQGTPEPERAPPAPASIDVYRYGDVDTGCLHWTDGCRICQRNTGDGPACSNIGIACQPTGLKCTARTDEEKK